MKPLVIVMLLLTWFNSGISFAQDTIVKLNGERLAVKIIQVDPESVSFYKQNMLDGPTFVEKKSAILTIIYTNGETQGFGEREEANQPPLPVINLAGTPDLAYKPSGQTENRYRIEHIKGKQYSINDERVKLKDVDNLLARSTNPVVITARRSAKLVRVFQKIIGYTSIASTPTGSVTSIMAISNVVKESKHGTIRSGDYWAMGLNLFGTMALPITSKILKNRETKLYDKAIDLYNIQN